jgi:hypothetical protein
VTTLSGAAQPAEILSVSSKEVKLRRDGQESVLPADEVLFVDFQHGVKPPATGPHLEVRFTDGTLVRCNAFSLKVKAAELRLLSGVALQCPLEAIHYVLCDAQDEANRAEFKQLLGKGSSQDVLRLLSRDATAINTFEGILGEADAQGETLQFKADDSTSNVSLARVRGLIFSRKPDDKTPPAVCKLTDVFHNVFTLQRVESAGDDFKVTTVSGLTATLPRPLVERFDFSLGKMVYLSDLEPVLQEFRFGIKEDLVKDLPEKYGRDATLFISKNGNSRQLRIGQKGFQKGLNVHSPSVLEFDVRGYSVFRCVLGLDDGVTRPGRAGVRIDGDGKELFSALVVGGEKARELELKITGVSRLRIAVDRGDDDDELGDHVDFGDARVTK